jgi:hypothetical protein
MRMYIWFILSVEYDVYFQNKLKKYEMRETDRLQIHLYSQHTLVFKHSTETKFYHLLYRGYFSKKGWCHKVEKLL